MPASLEKPLGATPASREAPKSKFIRWFAGTKLEDVPLVGGKNASLGEIYRELAAKGVQVPNGFSVTAEAYRHFLREMGVAAEIDGISLNPDTVLKTTLAILETEKAMGR